MYDVHTHFIPEGVSKWLKENPQHVNATWEKRGESKATFLNVNNKWAFELKEQFTNLELYLNEQKKAGVSHSLISPVPQLFLYDLSCSVTSELASVYNQALSKLVKKHPRQLSGLATLPLNNPKQAAVELRKSMGSGLRGAIIGPGCCGYMLSDDFFTPFWEEANRQKAIIFIHPLLAEDKRLKRRKMPNLIGVPWETTICATDILLSGLLDYYPEAKILLAHGGGFLPYQIGRLNKGFENWNEVSASVENPPIEYLKRFWFDSVLWHPEGLKYLTELVGENRIVPGSDFPFDLCSWPPEAPSEKGIKTLFS
jgi:predicted TIM-barrel fold metal-dependent hydrolase